MADDNQAIAKPEGLEAELDGLIDKVLARRDPGTLSVVEIPTESETLLKLLQKADMLRSAIGSRVFGLRKRCLKLHGGQHKPDGLIVCTVCRTPLSIRFFGRTPVPVGAGQKEVKVVPKKEPKPKEPQPSG